MSPDSGKGKQAKTEKKGTSKTTEVRPEDKLLRLSQIANIADYWRNEPASLLFAGLARVDEYVREAAEGQKKVLDGWDAMLEKVREVRSTPKVKAAMDNLVKQSSLRNPWKLMTYLMSFVAIVGLLIVMMISPDYYIIVVPVIIVATFGLQFYAQRRLNRTMRADVQTIEKGGGPQIKELSELCKDLTQSIVNALRYELPKQGRSSDTFTMRLLSPDYSSVKLRVEEKVKKRGRRSGDLYSVVWK